MIRALYTLIDAMPYLRRSPLPTIKTISKWIFQSGTGLSIGSRIVIAPTRKQLRYLFTEIFLYNQYYAKLPANASIIDCGANIGMATLYFKTLNPTARVTCYEPDPDAFDLLIVNTASTVGVQLYNKAVSDHNGRITFFVDGSGKESLKMSQDRTRLHTPLEIRAEAVRLADTITNKIDLLKLDIEGAEGTIIADLYKTKKIHYIERIIMEYHHTPTTCMSSILCDLEDSGFEYTITGKAIPYWKPQNQDILIHAWKKKAGGVR